MSVSLAAPLIFGLFTKRASNMGAIISAVGGIILTLYMTFFTASHVLDLGFITLNASTCGIVLSFVLMALSLIISH